MTVNTTDSFHNTPATDWQLLGRFDLPVGSDTQTLVNARLAEILSPLKLQPDILNRMLRSTQESASRAITSTDTVIKIGHIHMLVFALHHPELTGRTWGFFRIERPEGGKEAQNLPNHTIELYLYTEA